jgi:alkanesulfonate monooxygenase SsuD/methylene tetrahydromethanopterin reductase-like flavin-dependent oxidoreductase (luciferase family)
MPEQLNELGFYTLAGHSDTPRDLVGEVRHAERIGLGSAFISERFNLKDAATLSGAAGAVSETIGVATAATNPNTRHPMVTATFATTMHRLTGGRFALGLGRGFDAKASTAELQKLAELLPEEWIAPAATGTPEQCTATVLRQFDLGANGVILHGATPAELEPILPAYRAARPARFTNAPANPGRALA